MLSSNSSGKKKLKYFNLLMKKLATLSSIHYQNHNTILTRYVVEQARLSVPFIKLLRILLDKLSRTTSNRVALTLDTELNSSKLETLKQTPASIYSEFLDHTSSFQDLIRDTSEWMRGRPQRLSSEVDSFLFLLALYIIPPSAKIDDSPLQSDL